MVSLRRLFGLILLFLFFEVVVALIASVADKNVFVACAIMTLLALAVWVTYALVTHFLSRPRESAPPAGAAEAPVQVQPTPVQQSVGPQDEELDALIREANERLAAASTNANQRVKWTIGKLPLYLVVGLESAGKTSTISNSGVDAKLLAGESYRETSVVPTKLCNFWLASGAIFADVSGRIFSNDPVRWENLVRALGYSSNAPILDRIWHGRRQANHLRGVLLVCDATSFLGSPDPEKLAALSRKLQDRLQAIGAAFNTGFPVYVVFSKADAIPYFGEFFAHLSDAEDQRILGATLPVAGSVEHGAVYAESETRHLTSFFNRLYASLADKRLIVLAREDVAERRPFAYEFPRELKRIRTDVVRFLVDLFRPNPLQPSPKLRGFYFSGTRRVTPAASLSEKPDEFSAARSGADATVFFRARPSPPAGGTQLIRPAASSEPAATRWAFLSELFQGVILKDHAAPRLTGGGRFDWYLSTVFATVMIFGLVLVIGFATSFVRNRSLLRQVDATLARVSRSQPSGDRLAALQELDSLRAQLATLFRNGREGAPWGWRWGLYAGNQVLPKLRDLYFARFRKLILEPALGAMTARFLQLSPTTPTADYQSIYDQLKTYRTITPGECSLDKPLLERVLPDSWPGWATSEPEVQALANHQIQFYVSELLDPNPYRNKIPENPTARKQAQNYLINLKGPDKLLRGLLEDVNRSQAAADLSKYAPNYQSVLTGPGQVEGAFTRAGWEVVEKRISDGKFGSPGEACVVGAGAAIGSLLQAGTSEREIEDLYVRQYIKRWKDFLESEGLVNFTRADAADKLSTLAENNRSPLLALVFMISENTNFGAPAANAASAAEKQVTERVKSKFSSLFPRSNKAEQLAHPLVGESVKQAFAVPADIGRAFQPVHVTVGPDNPQSWLNDANRAYIGALGELANAVQPLAKSAVVDGSSYDAVRKAADTAMAAAHQLEARFNNTAEAIDIDLSNLIEAPIKKVKFDPGEPANAAARALCAKFERLIKKYPFNPAATEEVSIEELKRFFGPSAGDLVQFTKSSPFDKLLTKTGPVWTQVQGTQPTLAPQFLEAFNALAQFSDALFPGGSTEPKLAYTIMVTSPSKIQAMKVTVDGHSTPIDNVRESFVWPGAFGQSGARIDVTAGASIPLAVYRGPWAIFRMLQNADRSEANVFVFSKIRQGNSISEPPKDATGAPIEIHVQVETQAAPNVFASGYFSRLKCWQRAVQ
ncbi:MAG TPA: type VI secretion system membrane subunit TssM [Bryobacteraceae bacterium]|nr:type VI secretion system membrane subunit TssM [Bryobacteraceae bacterium]